MGTPSDTKATPNQPLPTTPPLDETIPDAITHHGILSGTEVASLTPELSDDASCLHRLILRQARIPPRPTLTIRGVHEIRSRPKNTKDKNPAATDDVQTREVVDFDFSIDLAPYFLPDADRPDHEPWHELRVVSDDDDTKTYRGGRSPSRGSTRTPSDDEKEDGVLVSVDETTAPGLMGWCKRYCQDASGVKSFAFRRRILGFSPDILRSALTSHLRSLNYRGRISVSTNLTNKSFVVYSPHWINRLRNNSLIYYFFTLSQLWVITWPIIKLLERRYAVVESAWFFSRGTGATQTYIRGLDEVGVAQDLAPVVTQAAWERRTDGRVLSGQEMRLLRQLEQVGRDSGRTVVLAGWDRMVGWGGDERE